MASKDNNKTGGIELGEKNVFQKSFSVLILEVRSFFLSMSWSEKGGIDSAGKCSFHNKQWIGVCKLG